MWAWGTSPHGLGISESRFWLLSPREYNALRRVYEQSRGIGVRAETAPSPEAQQRVCMEKAKLFNAQCQNRKARRLELIKRAQGTHVQGASNG